MKVSAEITAPKNERPTEGQVYFRVDCTAGSGSVEENRKLSMELTKLLEAVVVGSKALDPESLCVSAGRYAWRVKVELVVMEDDGNIVDCVINGAMIGLMDLRHPMVSLANSEVIDR